MGRKPRTCFPGAIFHVFNRGVVRGPIFLDDDDRALFLRMLQEGCRQTGTALIGYCLMTNHFHAAIKAGLTSVSVLMQRLMTGYAKKFNKKHGRGGHLFESRFESRMCTDDAYLSNVIRYIHYNPVKAGMVAYARDWTWSSARQFAADASEDPGEFNPWAEPAVLPSLLRNERVQAPLESLSDHVLNEYSLSPEELRGPARKNVVAARRSLTSAGLENGYSLAELARFMGLSERSVSRYAAKCQMSCLTPTPN